MKTKLCLAVVLGVLLSLSAFPALAAGTGTGDPTVMYVSHIRLAWTGRSSTGTDAVEALVFVRAGDWRRVAGATVTVAWTLDGVPLSVAVVEQETFDQGIARFSAWGGEGVYGLRVISVTHPQYLYYPTLTASTLYTAQ